MFKKFSFCFLLLGFFHCESFGNESLRKVLDEGRIDLALLLIEKGNVDVNSVPYYRKTLIHFAVKNSFELFEALIKKGIKVNGKTPRGLTALHQVTDTKDKNYVQMALRLIENGAKINVKGEYKATPLHFAVGGVGKGNAYYTDMDRPPRSQQLILTEIFIESGARLNARDYKKRTPLHLILESVGAESLKTAQDIMGSTQKTTAMSEKRYKEKLKEYEEYLDSLDTIKQKYENFVKSLVQMLVEEGASLDMRDQKGRTPLHLAVKRSDDLFKYLVQAGANVNIRDGDGNTPLHEVVKEKSLAKMKVLIEKGADVNAINNYGNTSLHEAVRQGFPAQVKLLLESGAIIHITNDVKDSPYHIAIAYDLKEIVELLEKYKDRRVKNSCEGVFMFGH